VTNGRIVISGNIGQRNPLIIAALRNKDHYNSHVTGAIHSEKYIFALGSE
jgi:hypothetical protein